MILDYSVRLLLKKKASQALIAEIYNEYKKQGDKFIVYPNDVNTRLVSFFSNQDLYYESPQRYQQSFDRCFENDETKTLDILENKKIISVSYNMGEDGSDYIAEIKLIKKDSFKEILKWVTNHKFVINNGWFSLNTLTGECFFRDNYCKFQPGSGYYDLLKEFLITDKKYLAFEEILSLQQQETIQEADLNYLKTQATERIKYFKRKLIGKGFGRIFIMYEGKGYTLLPKLI